MKPQDIIFFVMLLLLLLKQDARWFAIAGIISLVLSMPLFATWVFFSAQRLVYFAMAFFMVSIILHLISKKRK